MGLVVFHCRANVLSAPGRDLKCCVEVQKSGRTRAHAARACAEGDNADAILWVEEAMSALRQMLAGGFSDSANDFAWLDRIKAEANSRLN